LSEAEQDHKDEEDMMKQIVKDNEDGPEDTHVEEDDDSDADADADANVGVGSIPEGVFALPNVFQWKSFHLVLFHFLQCVCISFGFLLIHWIFLSFKYLFENIKGGSLAPATARWVRRLVIGGAGRLVLEDKPGAKCDFFVSSKESSTAALKHMAVARTVHPAAVMESFKKNQSL